MHTVSVYPVKIHSPESAKDYDYSYQCLAGLLKLDNTQEAKNVVRMTIGECQEFTPYHLRDFLNKAGIEYKEIAAEFDYRKIGVQMTPWNNIFWYTAAQAEINKDNVIFGFMRLNKAAPLPPFAKNIEPSNHPVLVNGWRKEFIPAIDPVKIAEGVIGHYEEQLRVSCPLNGDYWISWASLLYWHGFVGAPVKPAST